MIGLRRRGRGARNAFCAVAVVLVGGAGVSSARGEFTVGAEIPAFALTTADGRTVDVGRADGSLAVQIGGQDAAPKALVIHLLQPDCLQCRAQLEALKPVATRFREQGVVTLGIAHRGTPEDVRKLAQELDLPFPVLLGADSEIARQFAAGDTLGIADAGGVIRFAQVGFGGGDEKLWAQALEELLAGKEVSQSGVKRERLAVGDRLPAIHLASLRTGKPMALAGEDGRLVFRDEDGKESHPKAAVGMFSRY